MRCWIVDSAKLIEIHENCQPVTFGTSIRVPNVMITEMVSKNWLDNFKGKRIIHPFLL